VPEGSTAEPEEGYVGVFSNKRPEWLTKESDPYDHRLEERIEKDGDDRIWKDAPDLFADKDWYVNGKNIWIVQVGSRTEFGSFETFMDRVSSARVHVDDTGERRSRPTWHGLSRSLGRPGYSRQARTAPCVSSPPRTRTGALLAPAQPPRFVLRPGSTSLVERRARWRSSCRPQRTTSSGPGGHELTAARRQSTAATHRCRLARTRPDCRADPPVWRSRYINVCSTGKEARWFPMQSKPSRVCQPKAASNVAVSLIASESQYLELWPAEVVRHPACSGSQSLGSAWWAYPDSHWSG